MSLFHRNFRIGLLASTALLLSPEAWAGQLTASAFQSYNAANASSIQPGPFSLYTVPVDLLQPTQLNEGFTEVNTKATGFDITPPSQLQASLLTDIEPVVIGPGGTLYLTDGHHTFSALENSSYGASDPTVYVNVIANYSNLTTAQFWAQMQSADLLLPLNDGVAQTVNTATGAPIPTSLQGLTQDIYRGLEYSILKNKNSKLFTTTSNISGAVGSAFPGMDKETGLYADFINADAYRNANGGRGLPYLSPGDIQLATQWNLNPNSVTSEPNIGSVTVGQLPGFILPAGGSLTVSSAITNTTLATGTLAANGTFTGITQFNLGTPSNPIVVGQAQSGFVMQLGSDLGGSVTLSGTNTYTGGTTITAGNLIIANDAALGAAPPLTTAQFNSSLTLNSQGYPTNVLKAVEADNGIIFNSLTEGNGTLTIGTATGGTFSTSRPIAVDSEAATINVNDNVVTLNGPIVSAGTNGIALGNADGESDLTIDDLSTNGGKTATAGTLILSTPSPYFYGNIIIGNTGTPTVEVMSDAALGNMTGPAASIGQVELNGGTLQTGASFSAPERNLFLGGGSQIDLDGNNTTWGTLTDVKRTIAIGDSSATAASITFNNFTISQTATLQLDGSANGVTYNGAETVTFTNGILQTASTDTLLVQAAALGTTQKLFSGTGSQSLVNNMAPAWMINDTGGSAGTNPYNFLTYGTNGYTAVTYTDSGSGSTGGIRTATSTSIVDQTGNGTLAANAAAYALKVNDGDVITATGFTIALGDGTDPAGLIMGGGSAGITGGTLAFGGSQAVIFAKSTSTISSAITGSNGLTLAGSGTLTLSPTAAFTSLSGPITIDSGTLSLTTANLFATDVAGLTLDDVKSSPSNSILNFTASQTFSTLNSLGSKSAITYSGAGVTLTIGDANNLSSTISSTITQSGNAVTGALTKNGTGLLDISGATASFASGSTIVVNAGELRIGNGVLSPTATTAISVASGTELQYSGNGGSVLNTPISGAGVFHLLSGTVQLTGANTYAGGTVLELGSTLDTTTSNLPVAGAIANAGGTLVFDQDVNGTFSGVMSDGKQAGGPSDPNDIACTLVTCSGSTLSGTLIRDDSTTNGSTSSNVTLSAVQSYSGMTYIEAGTLTLGALNTITTSAGVDLGRVGGGATASLVLAANNTIGTLSSEAGNTTGIQLASFTLTVNQNASSSFGGNISGTGAVTKTGTGTLTLTGPSSYSGATTISGGTLALSGSVSIASSSGLIDNGIFDISAATGANALQSLSGSGTVNLGSEPLTLTNASGTFSGTISGTGALAISGGTEVLAGVNSYTGGTNINGGTLRLASGGQLSAQSSLNLSGTGVFDLNGQTQTVASLLGGAGNSVTLGSGALTVSGAFSTTFAGVISGTGSLTVSGTGSLFLTGNNPFTGTTTIASGSLGLGSSGSSAGSVAGNIVDNGTLTINRGNAFTYAGAISGTGIVFDTAAGVVTLTGTSSYTGTTAISSGATIALSGAGGISGSSTVNDAGTLDVSGTTGGASLIAISGSGSVALGAQTLTLTNPNGSFFSGVIKDGGIAGGVGGNLVLAGGSLVLTGTNTYTGTTTIASGASLQIGSGGTTGSIGSGAIIDNGKVTYFLSSAATLNRSISGSGGLTDGGTGTLTVTAAQAYTGVTSASSGSDLVLSGAGAVASSSSVKVNGAFDISATTSGTAIQSLTGAGTVLLGSKTLTITNGSTSFTGAISDGGAGGSVAVTGGTQVLGGTDSYTGGTSVTGGGVLAVASDASLGASSGGVALNGGTLRFTGASSSARNIALSGAGGTLDSDGNTDTISGVISGTGGLTIADSSTTQSGVVILAAVNTYSGNTVITGGTLTLGIANAIPTGSAVLLQGGQINFNGFNQTLPDLSGSGTISLGTSNVTVGSDNSSTSFTGAITGTGGLTKTGTGTLILDGTNNFTGGTTVSSGTLEVGDASHPSASIPGPVTVGSGATLSGHGSISGAVTIASGGNFQPGGTIGTINVGSATFASGSTYTVETNAAGQGDLTVASGAININSGAKLVVAPDAPASSYGRYTSYSILQAGGGITGSFGSVTSTVATLSPTVSYSGNSATLVLLRTDLTVANAATTANQQSVGAAIVAGGAGSSLNVALAPQSDTAVQQSFNQLSGDIHASLRSAAVEDSRIIRDTVIDHLGNDADGTVVWGAGFGGFGSISTDGDASGLHHDSAGFIVGADMPLDGGLRLGLAAAFAANSASTSGHASTASGNSGHVIGYGGWTDGNVDLRLGGDYGWGSMQVTRNVASFAQIDTDNQSQRAGQVFAEAGYIIKNADVRIEPYIDIASISATTGGFAETGGSTALSGAAKTDTATYGTLGMRFALTGTNLGDNIGLLTPHIDLGWQHALNTFLPAQTLTFQSLTQSFNVLGLPLSNDAAAVRAGFDLVMSPQATLSIDYDGSFGIKDQDNAVRGSLSWKL